MINPQDLKELLQELGELKEAIENNVETLEEREDFHSGFQEGYAYGIEHSLEKLNKLIENV